MRFLLLYRSDKPLTSLHRFVQSTHRIKGQLGVVPDPASVDIYVRTEVVEADSIEEALDLAKPMRGERFVNSMPVKLDRQTSPYP